MFKKNIYIETKVETALAIWGYIFVMLIDDYYVILFAILKCLPEIYISSVYCYCY